MSDCLNSKGKLPQIITCQHVSDTRHQSTPDNRPPRIIITPSYERPPDIIQTPSIAKRTSHDDPGGEGTLDCGARIEYPNGINERVPGLQSRGRAFNGKYMELQIEFSQFRCCLLGALTVSCLFSDALGVTCIIQLGV